MQKNLSKAVKHFKKYDIKIHNLMQKVDFDEWFKMDSPDDENKEHFYFETLCRNIVGQQLSGKAANSIFNKFTLVLKGVITPNKILRVNDQKLRDSGLSWAKIKYIKDLAQKVVNKELNLGDIDKLDDAEVIDRLIIVKGIGTWTAEMFLIFTLNRENVFSFGDLGLKKGFSRVYGIENPSAEQITQVIQKWEPYKTYGSICLWSSLEF